VDWPHHRIKKAGIPLSLLSSGERRLEAENFLSGGFGIRAALLSKAGGVTRLGDIARVWMPGRLKGIQVAKEIGTPFLAATQVFDLRPVPRKWLALARTSAADDRFAKQGQILVTCSGSVGRPTVATSAISGMLVSHDLLRVDAKNVRNRGWIYAFLSSDQGRAMSRSAQYGHIIKHLEEPHLEALPIPPIGDAKAERFNERLERVISLRDESLALTLEAEKRYASCFSPVQEEDRGELGFSVSAAHSFFSGRRRLDAWATNPNVRLIRKTLSSGGAGFTALRDAGYDVWVPGRYKRIPAEEGVAYRDSADILEVSPDLTKRFADCGFGDRYRGRVKRGWILIPSSGQVYGIIGTAVLATSALADQVVSNHVLRVAPRANVSVLPGYVVTALGHPTLGRPLLKSLAFGSSVPEISPDDLEAIEIVRLGEDIENQVHELAIRAADLRAEADTLEREMSDEATEIVAKALAG
jgi:hypothetical protein